MKGSFRIPNLSITHMYPREIVPQFTFLENQGHKLCFICVYSKEEDDFTKSHYIPQCSDGIYISLTSDLLNHTKIY